MNKPFLHQEGDKVKYNGKLCKITKVWNHGLFGVWYDIEYLFPTNQFHTGELSVWSSDIKECE